MWYAGSRIDPPSLDAAVTGIHFRMFRGLMRCLLHLAAPPEWLSQASVSLPSDSVMRRFEGALFEAAHKERYSVQDVCVVPGAEETLTFSHATVTVHVPNGNGLAKFDNACAQAQEFVEHAARVDDSS